MVIAYGFTTDGPTAEAAVALGDGRLLCGGDVTDCGSAAAAAERVDGIRDGQAHPRPEIAVVQIDRADSGSCGGLVDAFAAAAVKGPTLDPDPTPFGFQQLVFDDEATGRVDVDNRVEATTVVFVADPAGYRTPSGEPFLAPMIGGQAVPSDGCQR